MSHCSCHHNIKLQLGFSNFESEKISDENEDPLLERFRDEKWSFQNPATKESEPMSVVEVIKSQSQAQRISDNGHFKMFPPLILPKKDLLHGFPQSVAAEVADNEAIATKDKTESERIKASWLQSYHDHYAEATVTQALSSVFTDWNTRGFMVQSYHTETYLQPLVNLAKDQRKSAAKVEGLDLDLLPLSTLEKNICHSLGIQINGIHGNHEEDLNVGDFEERLDQEGCAKKAIIRDIFAQAKKNYEVYTSYNKEVKSHALETDLLIVLEKEKMIINVEAKSVDEKSLKNTLKKASDQQKIRKKVFMKSHMDILDSNWKFVSVIALPFIKDKEDRMKEENINEIICTACKRFIFDFNDKLNVKSWVEDVLQCSRPKCPPHVFLNSFTPHYIHSSIEKTYIKIYNRIIGFMSVSKSFGFASNVFLSAADSRELTESSIIGAKEGISSEQETQENISKRVTQKKLKGKHLSSLQLLFFWNEEQLQFLLKHQKRVLFLTDFGAGKTLMKKHMALTLASMVNNQREVFYISFASVRRDESKGRGFLIWKYPSVFDVASSIAFEDTPVKFLSSNDLLEDDAQNLFCSDLLMKFMKENKDSHIFIDEFPVTYEVSQNEKSFLEYLKERMANTDDYLWITLRLCSVPDKSYDKFMTTVDVYKQHLQEIGFEIPFLGNNMRNSSNVFKTFDSVYGQNEDRLTYYSDGTTKSLIKAGKPKKLIEKQTSLKVSIPNTTVDGCKSIIVPVDYNNHRSVDTLNYIISKYFKPSEPVVILLAEPKYLQIAETALLKDRHEVTMYNSSGKEVVSSENIEELKKYLQSPSGILLTGAEAFNGMQARNVVVVAGSSKKVRNYILRAISLVVFVQKAQLIEPSIYNDSSVHVDKNFLPSTIQLNEFQMKEIRWGVDHE